MAQRKCLSALKCYPCTTDAETEVVSSIHRRQTPTDLAALLQVYVNRR
jgi:hypothetical protein